MATDEQPNEPPIQDLDNIDIIGVRKDGGVDLAIVASSYMDGSAEHQQLLLDKLQSYLAQLNSDEFQEEFERPAPEKTRIIVSFVVEPDPIMIALLDRAVAWVEDNNARLVYEIKK
ncbi:hypothetical protein ETAA8_66630 [Anatilimnocola aggregata]|uniref:Uncharacterized protein n=1 Tax=Anatilimnocola aggregata TaxID=2528021 RepID=A0A517YMR0_9BACT|nr:DUF6572 domain-containing protein [Anatilimnocola aggregata]QDU31504.1 hypothetical protein ETAA8_66630 [Anatilimnocola aggregata]